MCDNALRYPQRNLAHDDEEEATVALETVVQMQRHAHVGQEGEEDVAGVEQHLYRGDDAHEAQLAEGGGGGPLP